MRICPIVILLFLSLLVTPCFSEEKPVISAESVILMDSLTKRVIFSKNLHKRLPPASTTKIMTALLVLKESHLERRVFVTPFASSMEPSKVYIEEREIYTTEDLLKGLLLNSGNDASVALAESVAQSEDNFVEMMNKVAKDLGAKNTDFKNSNGLPAKNQYSTAYDLALIVRQAMKDENIVRIMRMKSGEIEEIKSGRKIKLKNHNKMLWKNTPYLILGKTGYTRKARHCFAGFIEYSSGKRIVIVVLKSRKLWKDLEILAKRGSKNEN